MGNNQSNVREGLQFCSSNVDPLARRFMVDKDFRVDFSCNRNIEKELMTPPEFQWSKRYNDEVVTEYSQKREIRMSQQPVRHDNWQQQKQEEFCDFIEPVKHQKDKPKIQVVAQEKNVTENNKRTFEGIFGDVVLNEDRVSYKDCSGEEFNEMFNPKLLKKTFPMGISYGGLTKSVWFKDIADRDACFETMTGYLPPSYAAVMSNPSLFSIPNDMPVSVEEDKHKVFDGICENNVIVRRNGSVSYTDINGEQHCVSFNRNKIQKCFPHGICFGGLTRTIWLKNEIERDLCYVFMQTVGETDEIEEDEKETFTGLFGSVVLRSGHEVEYTSLAGDRVKAVWYDPGTIRTVFPMGITGGGLPSTIWFKDMEDLDDCMTAMKQDVC